MQPYSILSAHDDRVVFVKWVLDHDLKLEATRRMLEWRIEIDQNWSVKPGVYGHGRKRLVEKHEFRYNSREMLSTTQERSKEPT